MNLPDKIVGLGGAGRAISKTFLTQDWVMERAVEQDDGVDAYFVDTDTASDNDPADDVSEVEDKRDAVDDEVGYANVDAHGLHLINDSKDEPTKGRLLANADVKRIAQDQNLRSWWLEEDSSLVKSEGYSDGVARRRGLTKALYHYSRADDYNPLGSLEGLAGNSIAIIAGLGGGTGSGLMIDVARQMDDDSKKVLFGVLPHTGAEATSEEMANAYGALVELEKLTLEDENPFQAVVLISEDAYRNHAEMDEAIAYTIAGYYNSDPALDNLMEVYDETSDGNPPFAPFTIAVPQIITYPGGQLDERRRQLDDFISDRTDVLSAEETLLDGIESFIHDEYEEYESGLLYAGGTADTTLDKELVGSNGLYDARLKPLRELLESDFFKHSGYRTEGDSNKTFIDDVLITWDQLRENFGNETNEGMTEVIENLGDHDWNPRGAGNESTQFEFNEYIVQELENIARRAGVLKAINDIPDPAVRTELKTALAYNQGEVVSNASDIETNLQDLESELESAKSDVEETLSDAQAERDEHIDAWLDEFGTDIDSVSRLNREWKKTAKQLRQLETAFERFEESSEMWDSSEDIDSVDFPMDESDLKELDSNLKRLGLDPVEGRINRITNSIEKVKDAAREKLDDGGILGIGSSADRDDYTGHVERIEDDVFEVTSFEQEFRITDSGSIVEHRRNEMINKLENGIPSIDEISGTQKAKIRAVNEEVDGIDSIVSGYVTDVRDNLPDPSDEHSDPFDAIGVSDQGSFDPLDAEEFAIDSTEFAQDTDQKVDDIRISMSSDDGEIRGPSHLIDEDDGVEEYLTEAFVIPAESVKEQLESFASSVSDGIEVWGDISDIASKGDDFWREWSAPIDPDGIFENQQGEHIETEGAYVTTTTPQNLARLNQDSIVDANIWNGIEREHLLGEVERMLTQALSDESYVPLVETNRIAADGNWNVDRADYSLHRIHTTFLSRVFEEGIDDVERDKDSGRLARDEIGITEDIDMVPANDQNTASRCVYAGDWDFAATTFISGVFLDNIHPVRNQYRSEYRSITGKQISVANKDTTISSAAIRHTLGLDGKTEDVPAGSDGVYYSRNEFIDFDDQESMKHLLEQGDDESSSDGTGDADGGSSQYWDNVRQNLLDNFVERHGYTTTRDVE